MPLADSGLVALKQLEQSTSDVPPPLLPRGSADSAAELGAPCWHLLGSAGPVPRQPPSPPQTALEVAQSHPSFHGPNLIKTN